MIITYYVDLIFVWNFFVDFLFLILIHPKQKIIYWRILIAATIGAGTAVVMICFGCYNRWSYPLIRFLCAGTITLIGIPAKGLVEYLCNTALLYGICGAFFGINTMLNKMGRGLSSGSIYLGLSTGVVLLAIRFLYCFRRRNEKWVNCHYEVTLINNGIKVDAKAFYDSGNHLFEPISGQPVILIQDHLMQKLEPDRSQYRLIPYSAIGNRAGLLTAYRLEQLMIHYGNKRETYNGIYAAIAENTMFLQERCNIILHSQHIGYPRENNN